MKATLPKAKPRQRLRTTTRPRVKKEALPKVLTRLGVITTVVIVFLLFLQAIIGKFSLTSLYKKNSFQKKAQVLQEENVFLKGQLSELLSPLMIEKMALSGNMERPTKVYYLRVGKQ
ncbi:MAG: hypothetical protein ACPLPS_04770 [bacterium]